MPSTCYIGLGLAMAMLSFSSLGSARPMNDEAFFNPGLRIKVPGRSSNIAQAIADKSLKSASVPNFQSSMFGSSGENVNHGSPHTTDTSKSTASSKSNSLKSVSPEATSPKSASPKPSPPQGLPNQQLPEPSAPRTHVSMFGSSGDDVNYGSKHTTDMSRSTAPSKSTSFHGVVNQRSPDRSGQKSHSSMFGSSGENVNSGTKDVTAASESSNPSVTNSDHNHSAGSGSPARSGSPAISEPRSDQSHADSRSITSSKLRRALSGQGSSSLRKPASLLANERSSRPNSPAHGRQSSSDGSELQDLPVVLPTHQPSPTEILAQARRRPRQRRAMQGGGASRFVGESVVGHAVKSVRVAGPKRYRSEPAHSPKHHTATQPGPEPSSGDEKSPRKRGGPRGRDESLQPSQPKRLVKRSHIAAPSHLNNLVRRTGGAVKHVGPLSSGVPKSSTGSHSLEAHTAQHTPGSTPSPFTSMLRHISTPPPRARHMPLPPAAHGVSTSLPFHHSQLQSTGLNARPPLAQMGPRRSMSPTKSDEHAAAAEIRSILHGSTHPAVPIQYRSQSPQQQQQQHQLPGTRKRTTGARGPAEGSIPKAGHKSPGDGAAARAEKWRGPTVTSGMPHPNFRMSKAGAAIPHGPLQSSHTPGAAVGAAVSGAEAPKHDPGAQQKSLRRTLRVRRPSKRYEEEHMGSLPSSPSQVSKGS